MACDFILCRAHAKAEGVSCNMNSSTVGAAQENLSFVAQALLPNVTYLTTKVVIIEAAN